MKFEKPKKLPDKYEFFTRLLETVFPDVEEMGLKRTANGYKSACRNVIKELGAADSYKSGDYTGWIVRLDRNKDMFGVMYEINEFDRSIFGNDNLVASDDITFESLMYKYSGVVSNLVDSSGKTLNSLLNMDSGKVYKSFEVSSFFSYLLINREGIRENVAAFLDYCLKSLGVTDIEDEIVAKLHNFSEKSYDTTEHMGRSFSRITAKGARILMLSVFTLCNLLGRYPETQKDKPSVYFDILKKELLEDFSINDILAASREALLERVSTFEPRTVTRPGEYFLKDFFVDPVFELEGEIAQPPFEGFAESEKSRRCMITGMTGYGKTMYINMSALRILTGDADFYSNVTSDDTAPVIISVSASDFTDHYENERYREWTSDLVKLFFSGLHCKAAPDECGRLKFPKGFKSCMLQMAENGKLILLLDSFDEIPMGEVREAYLKSVRSFCDEYCSFVERGKTGAHVLLASREMSPETMRDVAVALKLDEVHAERYIYRLKGLDDDGRLQLIQNWQRYSGDDDRSEELYGLTCSNHFFRESSVSPYTLSMLCAGAGNNFGRIMELFCGWLKKMQGSKISELKDPLIKNVLSYSMNILEKLALETMKAGKQVFDNEIPERIVTAYIKTELSDRGGASFSDAELEKLLKFIKDVLLMQSGILTYAEGEEEAYTFTDENLKIALAAKRLKEIILSEGGYEKYRNEVYAWMPVTEFAKVAVPVICSLSTGHVPVAQLLVSDLVSVYTRDDAEECQVLQALTDLILDRYSLSILSVRNPGALDERYILSAQRAAVMRLVSSKEFDPGSRDFEGLKENVVFQRMLEGLCVGV